MVLSEPDVNAGQVIVPGLCIREERRTKNVSVAVEAVTVTLEAKPVKPSAPLVVSRKDYDALVSPMDLKLGEKYRSGQLLVAEGLEYGQWYHLAVNGTGQSLGWHFPTPPRHCRTHRPSRHQERKRHPHRLRLTRQGGRLRAFPRNPEGHVTEVTS